jgi:hypothetical protein
MKLLSINFLETFYFIIHLRFKYIPQQSVIKHSHLGSSFTVRKQVSHPYRTSLYFNSCFYRADEKTKGSGINGTKHYPNSVSPLFSSVPHSDLIVSFSNILTVPHIKKYISYFYVTILPCILVMRQQHTLSLSCVYF